MKNLIEYKNRQMDRKQIEEIAKKAYPMTRKESHVTDVRLLNKRQKNIHNFIKGFEAALKYTKEKDASLDATCFVIKTIANYNESVSDLHKFNLLSKEVKIFANMLDDYSEVKNKNIVNEFNESLKDVQSLNKSVKCYKLEEQSYLIKIDKMKSLLKQVEIMIEQNNMNDDFNGIWRDSDETILENIKETL